MLILGIETSGPRCGLALDRDGECLAEVELGENRRHAQTLVSEIGNLLNAQRIRADELDAIAVSIGPGSFTGLRIGVVCAKTLAYAAGCQLTAVDTLQAIAENSPADVARVHVISDAQRGDIFTARYERLTESRWNASSPPVIIAAQTWLEARGHNDVLSGPAIALHRQHAPAFCRVLSEPMWIPGAGTIARIGTRQIQEGRLADCMTLEPFYLRRSAAEERRNPSQP